MAGHRTSHSRAARRSSPRGPVLVVTLVLVAAACLFGMSKLFSSDGSVTTQTQNSAEDSSGAGLGEDQAPGLINDVPEQPASEQTASVEPDADPAAQSPLPGSVAPNPSAGTPGSRSPSAGSSSTPRASGTPGRPGGSTTPSSSTSTSPPASSPVTGAATQPPQLTPRVVLDEQFDDPGTLSRFGYMGGTWSISGGQLRLRNAVSWGLPNSNIAVSHTSVSGTYTVRMSVTTYASGSGSEDASLILGYSANNYVFVHLSNLNDAGQHGIFQVTDNAAVQRADLPGRLAPGPHIVRANVTGDTVVVFVDEKRIGAASIPGGLSGRVGVGTKDNVADFNDLTVTSYRS